MKNGKSKVRTIGKTRSRKKPMPEICVRYQGENGYPSLAHAHLQNSGGYLYLVWREGATVERRYLGKAAKSSTTRGPAGAGGRGTRSARRRARAGRPL
jgi:hypothetical protein